MLCVCGGSTSSGSAHASGCRLGCSFATRSAAAKSIGGPTESSKRSTHRSETIGVANEGVAAAGIVKIKLEVPTSVVISCRAEGQRIGFSLFHPLTPSLSLPLSLTHTHTPSLSLSLSLPLSLTHTYTHTHISTPLHFLGGLT
jgi:hypothetical protein